VCLLCGLCDLHVTSPRDFPVTSMWPQRNGVYLVGRRVIPERLEAQVLVGRIAISSDCKGIANQEGTESRIPSLLSFVNFLLTFEKTCACHLENVKNEETFIDVCLKNKNSTFSWGCGLVVFRSCSSHRRSQTVANLARSRIPFSARPVSLVASASSLNRRLRYHHVRGSLPSNKKMGRIPRIPRTFNLRRQRAPSAQSGRCSRRAATARDIPGI
jgi:hypothetical protein